MREELYINVTHYGYDEWASSSQHQIVVSRSQTVLEIDRDYPPSQGFDRFPLHLKYCEMW